MHLPRLNGRRMIRHGVSLILVLVLLTAALLRFWHLDARSVWFDEAFSLELATNCGLTELLDRTGRDVHPPGYYLLLKTWMWWAPRTEYGIRSLSAFLGVCGVALMYLLTRRLAELSGILPIQSHSQSISLSAAVLLATNAQHIYWSREARMYTFGVALTLLSTLFMLQWLRERTWRSGVGSALTVAALMLTHNYGVFTAVCQAGCVVWHEFFIFRRTVPRDRVRRVISGLGPWVFAGWMYLPWFTVLLQQRARVQQEFWISAFTWRTIPTAFYQHLYPLNDTGPVIDWLVLVSAAVVLFAASVITLWFAFRVTWHCNIWTIPFVLAVGPVCIAVVISIASVSVIDTRHLSYCFPFFVMLFCAAVYWLIPQEWAVYTIVFATGWSLFGEGQHRASLQTDQRGGVRAAVAALMPRLSDSETIVVQHPGIYHAVCFYLPNRDRIKLYLPGGLPRHFYGRPLIRQSDLISGLELEKLVQPRLISIDTGGFGGDQGFLLPERWKRQNRQIEWFQDVAWYQGSISAAEYDPQTPSVVNTDLLSESGETQNVLNSSTEFCFDFTQYCYDREWFTLPVGAGESGRVRPTRLGLAFKPSFTGRRENLYLSVRQDLCGDFNIVSDWTVPRESTSPHDDLNLRILLTQDSSKFDAETVDIRMASDGTAVNLRCGHQSKSLEMLPGMQSENRLHIALRRVGTKLSVMVGIGNKVCECETWISDQPIQIHLGDLVNLSRTASSPPSTVDKRCFLAALKTSADPIQYHGDDGVTDVTVPPSTRFWMAWSVAGMVLFMTSRSAVLRTKPTAQSKLEGASRDTIA